MQPTPHRLQANELGADHARLLADTLAETGKALGRPSAGACLTGTGRALTPALANDLARIRRRFPEMDNGALRELEQVQRTFLTRDAPLLVERVTKGHVLEGLGPPLRLDEVDISEGSVQIPPRDPSPRSVSRDVCIDAASLALDLAAQGRSDLGERLLSAYAGRTNDFELYGVVDYHFRQCAIERAAGSETAADARRWILLALSTQRETVVPPILVAVGGLVASGKSTVARVVADHLAAPRVEADRARQHLTRRDATRSLAPDIEAVVYRELLRRAELVLSSGRPVVLDACFPRIRQREQARCMARERGWPFLFIECRVGQEAATARLAARDQGAQNGSWLRIYEALARHWESTDHLSEPERLVLDCGQPLEETTEIIEKQLAAAPPGHALR